MIEVLFSRVSIFFVSGESGFMCLCVKWVVFLSYRDFVWVVLKLLSFCVISFVMMLVRVLLFLFFVSICELMVLKLMWFFC